MGYGSTSGVFFALAFAVFPALGLAESDPVSIFREAIDARNGGDIEAMMALFNENAVREDGSCNPPMRRPGSRQKII